MCKHIFILIISLLLLCTNNIYAQDIKFKRVLENGLGQLTDVVQDKQGYLWISTFNQGLQRYDGVKLKPFVNDPRNTNSLASGMILNLCVDTNNVIWMGMIGSGLEKFDPATNTFTHYRHNPKIASSISSDTVLYVLEDHLGELWFATFNGLDKYDKKTGGFIHYKSKENDPASIGQGSVFRIYEDKKGMLWISTGTLNAGKPSTDCILNRYDRSTGKFTRYQNDPANPNSNPGSLVTEIYEDRKGNFWLIEVSPESGLYQMDRSTGNFTRFYADAANPVPLSHTAPAVKTAFWMNFIREDVTGALWLAMGNSGLNRYDPQTNKVSHYGYVYNGNKLLSEKDTISGFKSVSPLKAFNSKDGLFWVASSYGGLFSYNYNSSTLPFYSIKQQESNSLYCEPNGKILWIATDNGLLRRDLANNNEKLFENDPKDTNSLNNNVIWALEVDGENNFWLGTTGGGLNKFDPVSEKFIHYIHNPANKTSIVNNTINYLFSDHQKNLWIATDSGISMMDRSSGTFTNYSYKPKDSSSIISNRILCIAEDKDHYIWVASDKGIARLDRASGIFRRYLPGIDFTALCVDSKGITWAGGNDALYYFDKTKDQFITFANQQSAVSVSGVLGIIEDNQHNLWVSSGGAILMINADRTSTRKYTEAQGIRYNKMGWVDNFKTNDGRLFLGHYEGYYEFDPATLKESLIKPELLFSSFKLNDKEVNSNAEGILNAPLWKATEIRLNHDQNVFSFDFISLDYISPGDEKYMFMLENYDNTWHDIGSDHRAYFFNIPPGNYHFKVKVVSGDGEFTEKSIHIIISPPWWKTWWAYGLYILLLILAGYAIYRYQKQYIVKKERQKNQEKELEQAREIEKAYKELKSTQAQLIQSEKMASLGELTAGIAHEIQNPLNFVNNFSEVNKELLVEMKDEMDKGNIADAKEIANDIIANQEKINHHGKRADAIVKGMLQHSRSSNGQKEPTNINTLTDEYLRLAYHGLRAKDKSFNATLKTDFDQSIGNINIIPQDIGRVILNLITNAFYVVDEKKKQVTPGYEPTVSVGTKKVSDKVLISVTDNGNGIPDGIKDKIFQPFFTTKPTGQGTGLGLSLSYDIVKAHGGELRVETKDGEGTTFIIQLPVI